MTRIEAKIEKIDDELEEEIWSAMLERNTLPRFDRKVIHLKRRLERTSDEIKALKPILNNLSRKNT